VQEESGVVLIGDMPAQVEVVAVDTLLGTEGVRANGVGPRSEDGAGGDVSAFGSLDAMGPGVVELGLPCYPSVPSPHACWRRVEDGTGLACSHGAAAH
jgi:hypothetical protein